MLKTLFALIIIAAGIVCFNPYLSVSRQSEQHYVTLNIGELTCTIGDNSSKEEHRAGYNGIFELFSVHQAENLFVPAYSGLNLEHVFDGSNRINDSLVFFEPRRNPMHLTQDDADSVVLYQPSLPVWNVESKTTFKLTEPYYLDVKVEITPHSDHFEGGGFGLFWASYINAPLDKSIYFLRSDSEDRLIWQQFCTQFHNHDSTVRHLSDSFNWKFAADARETLFSNVSEIRFAKPFYYGRFRNMVFILIFDRTDGIRFTHSPSGGGQTSKGDDTNPAWDFQWVHPKFEVGKSYTLEYRVVYKLWNGREDVLEEVSAYLLNH
jgi:hypothetical protein